MKFCIKHLTLKNEYTKQDNYFIQHLYILCTSRSISLWWTRTGQKKLWRFYCCLV